MAQIQPILKIELNPSNPVQEICDVIMSVVAYHPDQEGVILNGVKKAIDDRLKVLEEGVDLGGKSLRQHRR